MHLHEAIRTAQDAINDREFLPDRVRVVKIDGFDDSESSVPWPGLAELSECEIMTGAEAEAARERVREAALERLGLDEYEIGRASCRERERKEVAAGGLEKNATGGRLGH